MTPRETALTALTDLIDQVEKGEGSDRLDRAIAAACKIEWSNDEDGQYGGYDITPDRIRFTSSLDAARALIDRVMKALGCRGFTVQTDFRHDSRDDWCKAEITVPSREFQGCTMGKDAQARAWVAAALRAKAFYPETVR